jgi:hypothetical protein
MTKIIIKQHNPEVPVTKKPEPAGKTPPAPAVPKKKDSFIRRCLNIIADDIHYKLHGIKSEDREKWERYDAFCKMARGEK